MCRIHQHPSDSLPAPFLFDSQGIHGATHIRNQVRSVWRADADRQECDDRIVKLGNEESAVILGKNVGDELTGRRRVIRLLEAFWYPFHMVVEGLDSHITDTLELVKAGDPNGNGFRHDGLNSLLSSMRPHSYHEAYAKYLTPASG